MRPRPLLSAFLVCERVLIEQDGVLSAVRIIDVIGIQGLSAASARQASVQISILIALKSGDFEGSCRITVQGILPSGTKMPAQQFTANLDGGTRGNNQIIQMQIAFSEEGDYWFELYLNDEFVTKTPLTVVLAQKKNENAEQAEQGQPAKSPYPKGSGRPSK